MTDLEKIVSEERIVCFISDFDKTEQAGYIACLCREGEYGYWRTDWDWGPDKNIAQEQADKRNAVMGISPTDAALIQLGTMVKD